MGAGLEEIKASVGGEEAVSSWILIDQTVINGFADITNDHNYIHVDPEKAAQSAMGGTIAHGLLTLSMLPTMLNEVMTAERDFQMSVNYGYDKIRFLSPVRCNKRIRGRFKVLDFTEIRPGEWRKLAAVTIEIENEPKPALVAEWITLHYV
jgi:acyl dehydratase